jgi:hypothetical protein
MPKYLPKWRSSIYGAREAESQNDIFIRPDADDPLLTNLSKHLWRLSARFQDAFAQHYDAAVT